MASRQDLNKAMVSRIGCGKLGLGGAFAREPILGVQDLGSHGSADNLEIPKEDQELCMKMGRLYLTKEAQGTGEGKGKAKTLGIRYLMYYYGLTLLFFYFPFSPPPPRK